MLKNDAFSDGFCALRHYSRYSGLVGYDNGSYFSETLSLYKIEALTLGFIVVRFFTEFNSLLGECGVSVLTVTGLFMTFYSGDPVFALGFSGLVFFVQAFRRLKTC
jgi:hypothetical protein